jgi:hypothetical protein
MWSQTDLTAGTIVSDLGYISVLQDDTPFSAIFPWTIGNFNATTGAYLVSDNPCSGNPLVTHNSIAVTHNGEFVTHTP